MAQAVKDALDAVRQVGAASPVPYVGAQLTKLGEALERGRDTVRSTIGRAVRAATTRDRRSDIRLPMEAHTRRDPRLPKPTRAQQLRENTERLRDRARRMAPKRSATGRGTRR